MEKLLIKQSLYEGVCIYNELKNCKIKLNSITLSIEDKKSLALYLGLLSVRNNISIKSCPLNINISFKKLDYQEFIESYTNEFDELNFNTIDQYLEFLLNKKVIREFNKLNNIYIDRVFKEKHKILIKE